MVWSAKDTERALNAGLYEPGDDITQPPPARDTDPTGASEQPHDDGALRLQRAAAAQVRQSEADLNVRVPTVQYDAVSKKRYYDTAPRPLARLLGSPLAQIGKHAVGPNHERQISSGWGSPRPSGYDPGAARTIHKGLDFKAPYGEAVLACGDGTVTFVGYQSRESGVSVAGVYADDQGNLYNGKGAVVATRLEIGFGGIFIYVAHNGDFQNYRTEYFHLSKTNVREGQKVNEGDTIAWVGKTGVPGIGPHLHFQVAYIVSKSRALVNPTAMVPNLWPGHTDSTNSDASFGVRLPPLAPAGLQIASSQAANTVNGLDRAVTLMNQTVQQTREGMSSHSLRIKQTLDVQQTAQYAAAAAFQGVAPVVIAPMAFNFDVGTWDDGKVT